MNNDKIHDLTMLYLQNQDLSNVTPAELLDKYNVAFEIIKNNNVNSKGRTFDF